MTTNKKAVLSILATFVISIIATKVLMVINTSGYGFFADVVGGFTFICSTIMVAFLLINFVFKPAWK